MKDVWIKCGIIFYIMYVFCTISSFWENSVHLYIYIFFFFFFSWGLCLTEKSICSTTFSVKCSIQRRSQWPRSLTHELSSPAQTLGLWVRITFEALISVIYSVFVLSCVQVAALRRADPRPRRPSDSVKRSRNWKSGQGPSTGCRTIGR
jgi:hypothetical protein